MEFKKVLVFLFLTLILIGSGYSSDQGVLVEPAWGYGFWASSYPEGYTKESVTFAFDGADDKEVTITYDVETGLYNYVIDSSQIGNALYRRTLTASTLSEAINEIRTETGNTGDIEDLTWHSSEGATTGLSIVNGQITQDTTSLLAIAEAHYRLEDPETASQKAQQLVEQVTSRFESAYPTTLKGTSTENLIATLEGLEGDGWSLNLRNKYQEELNSRLNDLQTTYENIGCAETSDLICNELKSQIQRIQNALPSTSQSQQQEQQSQQTPPPVQTGGVTPQPPENDLPENDQFREITIEGTTKIETIEEFYLSLIRQEYDNSILPPTTGTGEKNENPITFNVRTQSINNPNIIEIRTYTYTPKNDAELILVMKKFIGLIGHRFQVDIGILI